jgi:hypothetical protein
VSAAAFAAAAALDAGWTAEVRAAAIRSAPICRRTPLASNGFAADTVSRSNRIARRDGSSTSSRPS